MIEVGQIRIALPTSTWVGMKLIISKVNGEGVQVILADGRVREWSARWIRTFTKII